jgi:hypothetical protein
VVYGYAHRNGYETRQYGPVSTPDGASKAIRRPDLVSRATRRAFRELCTDTVLREIDVMWQDEGFAPGPLPDDLTGERRTQFQSYLDVVDWTDDGHVARALRVFETLLHGRDPAYLAGVRSLLERDGYRLEDNGRIVATGNTRWRSDSLADLTDPSAIHAALDRISRAGHEDPALAIGSAKELIESSAKIVLQERGLPVNDRDDVPQLVRAV